MKNTTINKRPRKVATTIRLDPELKAWAQDFAARSGTDLSTFFTVTITQVRNSGQQFGVYTPEIIAYNKYLDDMTDRIDRGEESVS